MLTDREVEIVRGMITGRINAIRAQKGKTLDGFEVERMVKEYEIILHKLNNPHLVALMTSGSSLAS